MPGADLPQARLRRGPCDRYERECRREALRARAVCSSAVQLERECRREALRELSALTELDQLRYHAGIPADLLLRLSAALQTQAITDVKRQAALQSKRNH